MLAGAVELFDVDHLFNDLELFFINKATNTHTAGSDAGTTAHALMLFQKSCSKLNILIGLIRTLLTA